MKKLLVVLVASFILSTAMFLLNVFWLKIFAIPILIVCSIFVITLASILTLIVITKIKFRLVRYLLGLLAALMPGVVLFLVLMVVLTLFPVNSKFPFPHAHIMLGSMYSLVLGIIAGVITVLMVEKKKNNE